MKKTENWCKLPYSLLSDERLTAADAVLYAVLRDIARDGTAEAKTEVIAQLTGLSVRTTHRGIQRLKECGYIISSKTTGRKQVLELLQVIPEQEKDEETKAKRKPRKEPEPEERPEHVEEALKSILAKKIRVKNPRYVEDIYQDLKIQAKARVRDQSKLLAYLSKMIQSYEDKSDGFDPYMIQRSDI